MLLVSFVVRKLWFSTTKFKSEFDNVFLHRAMMAHLSATCNHSRFARLFQKQLIQVNDLGCLVTAHIKAGLILPWPEK